MSTDHDLVVRGATIVDGLGGAPYEGDVACRDGVITNVGEVSGRGVEEIDGRGQVIAPGFIDPHTHYDANLFWDPEFTPSSRFGITSVIYGNCGYALAPVQGDALRYVIDAMSTVEQIPVEAIEHAVPWDWASIDDYFNRLARTASMLNFATLVGHVPIRASVLGPVEVHERHATPDEIGRMAAILRRGLELGALGFSTDQVVGNPGPNGTKLPGQICGDDELLAFAAILGGAPGPGLWTMAPTALLLDRAAREEDQLWHERLAAASGRPVVPGPCLDHPDDPGVAFDILEMARSRRSPGVAVIPQISTRPSELWGRLDYPMILTRMLPTLLRAVQAEGAEGVRRIAADESARAQLREEATNLTPSPMFSGRWDLVRLRYVTPRHADLIDRTVASLAEERGCAPTDVLLDIAVESDFETQFGTAYRNTDDHEVGRLVAHPEAKIGSSDAGAHIMTNVNSCFAVWTLQHWWRDRGVVTLERAVQMLTADQCDLFGISDRGRLSPGLAADLVLFDPDGIRTVGTRFVADQPEGGRRIITDAVGISMTAINGVVAQRDGESMGSRSGQFLRPNATAGV